MQKTPVISAIVPFYNSEFHIENAINSLIKQDFKLPIEIILINDGSTDSSVNIINSFNIPNIKLFSNSSNYGPAAARNLGLRKAKGDFIFFLDSDDTIDSRTLSTLYKSALETNADLVFCDCKWIENNLNQRQNIFSFPYNKLIQGSELTTIMGDRLFNPLYVSGPLSFKGKLIKQSIIHKNNIKFEEKLRYLEDEIFMWNILSFVKKIQYLHEQFYNYNVHPNISTTVAASLNRGFPISKFKVIKDHIKKSFSNRGCSKEFVEQIGDQAFVYFIINVLVSISKSILQGKIDLEVGLKSRKKIIYSIIYDKEVLKALKNYIISEKESKWIPFFINLRIPKLLELSCTIRAKKILKIRKTG